ncbi:ABC transporter ATP-binding protein [Streptococcus loxodontisalivarius]|uniref:ABC-2 type transport system ATP-binding protein n=1 Tax=Streptococcus loxodontisalivarius TaxID=1349415 RepID=A0ABS2PV42_9STRE|nr:ABC transporter ATP-binding protein [Streptococcus loxodontisalivarius]MBM7643585.1 ABC-2 type transport system ATP-binding protein [Streptococcus loxodontisalivarius]
MTILLDCQNIGKKYDNSDFELKKISFQGEAGEIIGLIGQNGAGKTTLFNLISNLTPRDSGEIFYCGEPVGTSFYRNDIGYLSDQFSLYSFLTIKENLDFVIKVRHLAISREEIDDLLSDFNLLDAKYKAINQLSKGMKQKFNFIISILHRPRVLLLDEPFDGLDPQQIRAMQEWIRRLAAEGTCILLSSHILDFIDQLCHRILFIKKGQLAQVISQVDGKTKKDLELLFSEDSD